MIPSTDFDRLITSWLEAAGPADLGRETIDAALQAARGRRQRRGLLAWLVGPGSWPAYGARRGFTALPAILRIALLVGLVLALLGGTLYVGSRVLRPIAALPLGAWVAKMPDNMSFGGPSGSRTMTLAVGPTTRVRLSNPREAVFESSMTVVADHQVQLVITSVRRGSLESSGTPVAIDHLWLAGCKLGDVGLYTWSISADGALLTLASDGDACPSREAVLARTWNAHQIPFGAWNAIKPDNLSFGSVSTAGETMMLSLGETAAVDLPMSASESGWFNWFNSTVTRAGDYWEFTSFLGAPTTPVSVDGRVLAECNVGDVGRYVSSLSADGSQLTLASVGDACPAREAVLARTWGYLAPP